MKHHNIQKQHVQLELILSSVAMETPQGLMTGWTVARLGRIQDPQSLCVEIPLSRLEQRATEYH